ncbi:solute carrier family 2, facilitated glucose transporter member 9-like [Misgurnus anguillicaudatus]|uniref:solute carrier family 2, facilitated glucose transporter member 9-like n=1 Tax=Misgurnus anguillicaudatus TaxID=75329 RepID=UPI003CCF6C42
MAEEVLKDPNRTCTRHLTLSLLAVALLSSLGSSLLYGYNLAVVNSPALYIKDFYNKTIVRRYGSGVDEEHLTLFYSITVSIFAIGGLLGSLTVIQVTTFGRKGTLIRSTVLVFVGGGLMGFSRLCGSPEIIIIGRFITGIHSGISLSVVPMFLGEIAPKNLSGFLGLLPSIFICLGVFIAQVLGLHEILGKEEFWPLLLSLVILPTFIQLVFLSWFPESPRYLLIEKQNIHATITALKWYRAKCNIQAEVEEMQEEQRTLTSVKTVSVLQLFKDSSCFTIERVGRRPLMIAGFSFMCICCAGITFSLQLQTHVSFMHYISVICVVGIIAGFCIGPGEDLFKQSHRPAAYSVGGFLNWISNFTVGFVFPFLQMSAGAFCYLVFCGVCVGVALYVYFIVPETKNKTFVEISRMFALKNRREIEKEPLAIADQLSLKKMNGYGSVVSADLEKSS